MASIKLKGDTSGELTIQAPSVAGTNTLDLPASSGTLLTTTGNGSQLTGLPNSYAGTKNRIINGNMAINQRGSGALENGFLVDRFSIGSSQASKGSATVQTADVPAKFTSALKYTSSTAYSVLATDYFFVTQKIEGNNIADLNWGTSDAQTITLSFWVKSSLTGTFGGALRNSAFNYNYPYTYTISSADTWEKKSVTITGPTSGTWLTNNGTGIDVWFSLGMGTTYSDTAGAWTTTVGLGSATGATSVVGTSGATWLVTGVQLEVGDTATDFENLQYTTQLQLCQRYCQVYGPNTSLGTALAYAAIRTSGTLVFKQTMRAIPTVTPSDLAGFKATNGAGGAITSTNVGVFLSSVESTELQITVAGGLTIGQASLNRTGTGSLTISAEL